MLRRVGLGGLLAAIGIVWTGCADSPVTMEPESEAQTPSLAKRVKATLGGSAEIQEADHFLVMFGGRADALSSAVAELGGSVDRTLPEIGAAQVSGIDDDGAETLRSIGGVSSVTRDLIVQWTPTLQDLGLEQVEGPAASANGTPDPTTAGFFPCQWNMTQCDGPGAWAKGQFGDPSAKVAVLDTGTDPLHQDLSGRIDVAHSISMLSPGSSPCGAFDEATFYDLNFHGSFVSGIVTSNGVGVAGIAPLTQVVGVKVLDCTGFGSFGDIIAGILYAANLSDVSVINMSLGAYFPKNLPGAGQLIGALSKAINFAQGVKGKLVVSSSGNEGAAPGVGANLDKDKNFVHVPSQAGAGVAAWAGDIDGAMAGYSNFGRSGSWVGAGGGDVTPGSSHLPLPGCDLNTFYHTLITSVCSSFVCGAPDFYLIGAAGTSFSTPLVSGVAALADGKYGGNLNGNQLRARLAQTADDLGKKGVDGIFSHGRVNASNAVE